MKWNRAKRREMCSCHFGSDDIIVDGFIFNNVHVVPDVWAEDQEVDFYLDTGDDICLLRLRNNDKNQITFCEGTIMYLVVEKKMGSNMLEELRCVVAGLRVIGIPDADDLKGQKTAVWPAGE